VSRRGATEASDLSLRDLRQLGVLLPKEEWGQHDLRTTVNKGALAIVMIVGIAGLMIFMWQITRISLAAIELQVERFRETREEIRHGDDGDGSNEDQVHAEDRPSNGH